MIYTITFNPAVDLVIRIDKTTLGDLNRSTREDYVAGGKGINMSVILKRLGFDNTAIVFLGGFTGEYIKQQLEADDIPVHVIPVKDITRINVKIKSNEETEINATGATITREKINQLFDYLNQTLTSDDIVFLAGNKAPGMSSQDYVDVAKCVEEKGAKLVLDTTKELLLDCLPHRPFIIKPNHHELGELFDVNVSTLEDIIRYATKLQRRGARHVLVSRGAKGSVLVTEDEQVFVANVPDGKLVNSVGAGDSMLAGFMAEFIKSNDYKLALKKGAATGSATAFSVGIATKEMIDNLVEQIVVQSV